MSEDEERDLYLKRSPGGLEALEARDQERIRNARDPQLDRAMDQLKGFSFFGKRPGHGEKMAKKIDKTEEK
jgi:hypothetical protein